MIHVMKLAYVLGPNFTPIPIDPIPKDLKIVDRKVIYDLEKQRALHRESEELYVDPRELWKALELKQKAYEEGTYKYLVPKYLEFQMNDEKNNHGLSA
uniref:Uncharacterized protein n=1 Tax=Lactuca sativa TaxID=4236 RepID=A0A9R1W3M7_LACSA|nr:hypothetical protein LSAT_V11C300132230 [Lactuca sativa]